MNTYKLSDGTRMTKSEIDRRVKQAKKQAIENQLNEFGYNFCQECVSYGLPGSANEMELRTLDCSHKKSVKECQESGQSEISFDVSNIDILCRFHHKLRDKLTLMFKNYGN
jgi:hypothetical protein